MSSLTFQSTPLTGVKLVQRTCRSDERGQLARLFCMQELAGIGWIHPVKQINHTVTRLKGTVRGMHYQKPPVAEMKLVSCIRGSVWDVAVDLRADSPTFLQWFGYELSESNQIALLIPEGVAHGFQALQNESELIYCHSENYQPAYEAGLNPLDPYLSIRWPLSVHGLSSRDRQHPFINSEFRGVSLS
ncbi:hypothetical protein C4K68_05115 [Pokkaliibacter plantistimulans]|uniref:dTDP-4-dehydrorhamnose 3,5-epimerase n=1 Tax=Proteobacteria bacterium 228 TaxID=2083153 RepID=A0A2S5KU96_9PROT|nr:dTDP-4-dehydrorhamnose 3,5-epimerase family protein [Pokkaliibacter plantistimulans]PPC78434.1 hypothetical protein C4K68_05115 [Pokkaliibacter plantistimulans]